MSATKSNGDTEQMVYNVYKYFEKLSTADELPADHFKEPEKLVADISGLPRATVHRIVAECEPAGNERPGPSLRCPPPERQTGTAAGPEHGVDTTCRAVRRAVNEMYRAGEYPTAEKVWTAVRLCSVGCADTSLVSVRKVLARLKYRYKRCENGGRALLVENGGRAAARCRFLRSMLRLRGDGRPVVYFGETCVFRYPPADAGRACGKPKPGDRVAVCCAASGAFGLAAHAPLYVRCRRSADGEVRVDAAHYQSWFVSVLGALAQRSVVVMDCAPPHRSAAFDDCPQINATSREMREWLTRNAVDFLPEETHAELRVRVKKTKPLDKRYALDRLAFGMGHEVVRLPPGHRDYNPLEFVWARVRAGLAAMDAGRATADDAVRRTDEVIGSIAPNDWKEYDRRVYSVFKEDYEYVAFTDAFFENTSASVVWDFTNSDDEQQTR